MDIKKEMERLISVVENDGVSDCDLSDAMALAMQLKHCIGFKCSLATEKAALEALKIRMAESEQMQADYEGYVDKVMSHRPKHTGDTHGF